MARLAYMARSPPGKVCKGMPLLLPISMNPLRRISQVDEYSRLCGFDYNKTMLHANHQQGTESELRKRSGQILGSGFGDDVVVVLVLEENEAEESKKLVNDIFEPGAKGKGKVAA